MTERITKGFLEEKIRNIINEQEDLGIRAKASIALANALSNAKMDGVHREEVDAMVKLEFEPTALANALSLAKAEGVPREEVVAMVKQEYDPPPEKPLGLDDLWSDSVEDEDSSDSYSSGDPSQLPLFSKAKKNENITKKSKFLKENKTMTTKITKKFLKETIRKILKEQDGVVPDATKTARNYGQMSNKLKRAERFVAQVKKLGKNGEYLKNTPAYRNALATIAAAEPSPEPSALERGLRSAIKSGGVTGTVKESDLEEGGASDKAPGHYCIHHGGVQHEGKIVAAEAVQHVEPDENGFISHYDMMLEDGTVLEDISASDIQITNATLEANHGRRGDDHKPMKAKKAKMEENEELEEGEDEKSKNESKIQTPEQENTLYEQRFTPKNNKLFEKLVKEWTK